MDFLEVSAKTVDEAVIKASIEMGISSDQLEINVISEGSSGFLGFGSKPAVIQVRKKAIAEKTEEPYVQKAKERPEEIKEIKKEKEEPEKPEKKEEIQESPAEDKKETSVSESRQEKKRTQREAGVRKTEREIPERTEEEISKMKTDATEFLASVFGAMDLPVQLSTDYDKEADLLSVDFSGEDMGVLIGKRGQTLDSLQYLVSLVVNKGLKDYVRVKLDTEDYRKRRKDTLENLAKNIAFKVKRSRKAVSLEAMNPYERRIIHSALQGNKYVETYSEGSEPYRHVVVTPKKDLE